jgi:alpha-beta hydrolase superfamily lysophospholipase
VLIVEAEDDQIVCAASRAQLKALLPEATVISLPRAGHGLLGAGVPAAVLNWIADGLA